MKHLAIVTILLAACGGRTPVAAASDATAAPPPVATSPPVRAAPATPPPRTPGPPILTLGEAVLINGKGTPFFKLHADGRSERIWRRGWGAGPTLAADGALLVQGHVVSQVRRDGDGWTVEYEGRKVPLRLGDPAAPSNSEGDADALLAARVLYAAMRTLAAEAGKQYGKVEVGPFVLHDRNGPFARMDAEGHIDCSADGEIWTKGPFLSPTIGRAFHDVHHVVVGTSDGRPRRNSPATEPPLGWRIREGAGGFILELASGDTIELEASGELWRTSVDPSTGAARREKYGRVEGDPRHHRAAIWTLGLVRGEAIPAWEGLP